MSSGVLIDGTRYEIKGGSTCINGTRYKNKKGSTCMYGTGYDIQLAPPVRVTLISDGDVGYGTPDDGIFWVKDQNNNTLASSGWGYSCEIYVPYGSVINIVGCSQCWCGNYTGIHNIDRLDVLNFEIYEDGKRLYNGGNYTSFSYTVMEDITIQGESMAGMGEEPCYHQILTISKN